MTLNIDMISGDGDYEISGDREGLTALWRQIERVLDSGSGGSSMTYEERPGGWSYVVDVELKAPSSTG